MLLRRTLPILVVLGAMLVVAGPAQAAKAPVRSPSDTRPAAQNRWCVPCAIAAGAAVVRVAKAIKTARTARKLRAAGKKLKATAGTGVKLTSKRVKTLQKQALRVVSRGKAWVQAHWHTLASYTKACFLGILGEQAWEEVNGAINTLDEWRRWLSNPFHGPGLLSTSFLNDGYRELYYNPNFDFGKTLDNWRAACGAGIVIRGAQGY